MLFIFMSKHENLKPQEYYAQLIILSSQIHHIQIIYNNKIKQKYEKFDKTKWNQTPKQIIVIFIKPKTSLI